MGDDLLKGRGARIRPKNSFSSTDQVTEFIEGIDEPLLTSKPTTVFIPTQVRQAISKNDSPDLPLDYSVNPYQGCEHGCIYCYARNSHQYWGYDAGLGFETQVLVKKDIVHQLQNAFDKNGYVPKALMLSGNTDCYQPAERTFKLTKGILELCLNARHPVSVITKNTLIFRDIDILRQLAEKSLVHVYFSINHLDVSLKSILEPRTATAEKKMNLIRQFSEAGIPCGVMIAPIIPSINSEAISSIMRLAGEAGARKAGYTIVRLNGQVKDIFRNWLQTHYPDRETKVMHQIAACHGGQENDTEWGRRIKGGGPIADAIRQVFHMAEKKYLSGRAMPEYDYSSFRSKGQLNLFGKDG
ncbi:PA0069 family radical SAM protein [Lunatibacter salilacus]|uniref:PA0069 family radical SAM protein n=1 Tax=Lunatibacter salilacus TaxID=2483804 RepID=UPI00131B1D26|nr:PA0069 family radical SAM protein [Lunatibacter salilacus]